MKVNIMPVMLMTISAASMSSAFAIQSDNDDQLAVDLLQGARAARLAYTQGVLHIGKVVEAPLEGRREESRLVVEWIDDSLRFRESSPEGIELSCSIRHHGETLFRTEKYGGSIDDSERRHLYDLFDPRLLGACPFLFPSLLADRDLFPTGAEATILEADAEIDGVKCVKIQWKHNGMFHHYWIANSKGFPVLKIIDFNNSTVVESKYERGQVLPGTVQMTLYAQPKVIEHQVQYTVESFSDAAAAADIFSIHGLGLEVGESMTDQRIHRITGFWNGNKLVASRTVAVQQAVQAQVPMVSGSPFRRGLIILNVVMLACVGLGYWLLRSRKRVHKDSS